MYPGLTALPPFFKLASSGHQPLHEAPVGANLKVVAGPDLGRTFPIEPMGTLIVGRGQSSNTWLSDPFVSRVHFIVQDSGAGFVLLDAGSSSGVTVNGERVQERPLVQGDRIAIGETELQFQLAGPAPTTAPPLEQAGTAEPSSESAHRLGSLVGKRIHSYEIKKILGQGSSGIVFGALDTQKNRPVALKVLWPELTQNEDEVQRFIRAMKTMMPVRHVNLIRVYGAGKTKTTRYLWTAMEYVQGHDLTKVIEQIGIAGMLDWRYAFRVMTHVARALEVAHGAGIIHRNITPKNILVRTQDKVAKLGDLMLAKAMGGSMAESVTRPGQLVGDLAYMAPECTTATTEAEIDGRADLYNLGAATYALLTGQPPFQGDNIVAMIHRIRTERPPAPSTFQMSVFAQFEGVVMRLLEKNPADRFPNASELLAEIERIARFQNIQV